MTRLRRFGDFWWEFVVGDDWRIAVGVVVALGVSAAIADSGHAAWWLVPVAVVLLLYASLRREARANRAATRR
ncbi:MAG TPA: hypothetical protein VEH52_09370 [Gaiellaceae bacterium]|nr:hypothetical protein [Gaiellaceae bacterium]